METNTTTVDGVKGVIVAALGIEDRASTLGATTALFGTMPELDSLAIVELVVNLEQRFGIEFQDSDITGDVFETIGTLADFVDSNRA